MTEPEIYSFLGALFEEVFMRDDIALTPNSSAENIAGWDSFKQIEILVATQERFAIKFTTQEMDSLRNLGDLVVLILQKTA